MRQIEDLLRRRIGLNSATIGVSHIERAIRLRMKHRGLTQPDAYHDLLTTSGQELEQLIEAVVVTETWFFRDREPFHVFARLAQQKQQQRRPATGDGRETDQRATLDASVGPLRVLSLPCASGEEPYSLAIALLDAGVAQSAFAIHAADISTKALMCAKRAVYGKNSFRGRALEFRDHHFRLIREGYALNPTIRRCVKFARGNILDAGFLDGAGLFDFIFCRNLLIYFDPAMQVLALSKLHRLLADDGVLFVGPAELPLVLTSGFVNAGLPMAFACRKAPLPGVSRTAGGEPRSTQTTQSTAVDVDSVSDAQSRTTLPDLRALPRSALELARQFADTGRFDEAAAICDAYLADEGPSAQVFHILGRIRDAQNDPAAIVLYRKALYLEPNHYQTLVQIALALEKSGDVESARLYQRRAQRAQSKA